VRPYKEYSGADPPRTRVLFAGADTLVVVLKDTMTVQDCSVAALREHERLREQRLFLTTAAEDQFGSIVEGALGRRTLAWVGGFDIHRDIALQIFTLRTRAHRRTRRADIRLTAVDIGSDDPAVSPSSSLSIQPFAVAKRLPSAAGVAKAK
jgi:uncharacterized protein YbcI